MPLCQESAAVGYATAREEERWKIGSSAALELDPMSWCLRYRSFDKEQTASWVESCFLELLWWATMQEKTKRTVLVPPSLTRRALQDTIARTVAHCEGDVV